MSIPVHSPLLTQARWLSYASERSQSQRKCWNEATRTCDVLDVIVGQLLALFRWLQEGLRPDSPSEEGVIRRVVPSFTLYLRQL